MISSHTVQRYCPCGSKTPLKPGLDFCTGKCAQQTLYGSKPGSQGKKKPTPIARPAVARGIPAAIVDTLIDVLGIEEALITRDALLGFDLGADEMDFAEIALALEQHYKIDLHDADGWEEDQATVDRVMKDVRKAGVRL